jgi:hypothetical protein
MKHRWMSRAFLLAASAQGIDAQMMATSGPNHFALPLHALEKGDIDDATAGGLATSDLSNSSGGNIQ